MTVSRRVSGGFLLAAEDFSHQLTAHASRDNLRAFAGKRKPRPGKREMLMRATLAVIVTVLAATYVAAAAQQNPFVGRWNITGTGSDNHLIYFLEVKQVGDHLEGMFLDRVAHAQPIPMIKVENGELTWQFGPGDTLPKPACGPVYHAKIEKDKLIGHHETPGAPCPSARGGRAGEGAAAAAPANTPAAPPAPP